MHPKGARKHNSKSVYTRFALLCFCSALFFVQVSFEKYRRRESISPALFSFICFCSVWQKRKIALRPDRKEGKKEKKAENCHFLCAFEISAREDKKGASLSISKLEEENAAAKIETDDARRKHSENDRNAFVAVSIAPGLNSKESRKRGRKIICGPLEANIWTAATMYGRSNSKTQRPAHTWFTRKRRN